MSHNHQHNQHNHYEPKSMFFVVLENQDLQSVLQHEFFKTLANEGTLLTNYHGIDVPPQSNGTVHFSYLQYLSLTSGDAIHVNTDSIQTFDVENLSTLFKKKGVTWKSYIENLPHGEPFLFNNEYNQMNYLDAPNNQFYPSYVRKHNPFINYLNVQNDSDQYKNIVNATQLLHDIENDTVPQYALYIPNQSNNSHNTNLDIANDAMMSVFTPLFKNKNFVKDRIFIFLFDESYFKTDPINLTYAVFWGQDIKRGEKIDTKYNPYNMYYTVIDNFQLNGYDNPKYDPIKGYLKCD